MSKQFVLYDNFKEEVKKIHRDITDMGSELDDMYQKFDVVKEAVNTNADGCQELESRVDELTKRLDKMNRSMQIMRQDVNAKNTDGSMIGLTVGIIGVFAFIWTASEISRLAKEIDAIEAQVKKGAQRVVTEKPAPEVSFHEDGTYDTKNRVSDVSSEKSKEG